MAQKQNIHAEDTCQAGPGNQRTIDRELRIMLANEQAMIDHLQVRIRYLTGEMASQVQELEDRLTRLRIPHLAFQKLAQILQMKDNNPELIAQAAAQNLMALHRGFHHALATIQEMAEMPGWKRVFADDQLNICLEQLQGIIPQYFPRNQTTDPKQNTK